MASDERAPPTTAEAGARDAAPLACNGAARQGGHALPVATFATDMFPADVAFEAWRAQFGGLNEIIFAPGQRFSGRASFWQLGDFTLGVNETSPMRIVRGAGHVRRDDFDHWVLRVSAAGMVRSRCGDLAYRTTAGELAVERLNEAYEDEWSADRWVILIVTPGTCPAIEAGLAAVPRGPVRGVGPALLADFLLSLARRLPEALDSELPALARTTQAMVAATFAERPSPDCGPPLRLSIEQTIRANLASARLSPARIAAMAGVSRATLYRLFDDRGGVAAHLRRLRLEAVHAALSDPAHAHIPVAQLAERSGFHCTTAFNRTFRAAFGATPSEVRAGAVRHGSTPALTGRRPAASRDFLDLLFNERAASG